MEFQDTKQRTLAVLLAAFVLSIAGWQLYQWWTQPVPVAFDNLKYIQLLRTAVSSRSSEMLQKVEDAVDQRFESGKMSDSERAHFQELIALADEEKWEEADRGVFEFAEAQLGRSRAEPPTGSHTHIHSHEH